MTIRRTLLIAFLLVSVLPSVLLTSLAFFTAGSAMRDQIGRSLQVQSATVSEAIDKTLFERLQNSVTWRQLEVMQEIQVGDIDKRLAKFLSDVQSGYGAMYRELSCTDPNNRIVASSNPSRIGQIIPPTETMLQSGGQVWLGNLALSPDGTNDILPIRTAIPSRFKSGLAGELYLLFNWNQIYRILDQAAQGDRMVVLLDQHHRIIAASSTLRKQGMLLRALPAQWLPDTGKIGPAILDGTPFGLSEAIVGYERSSGFQHFARFGWTTVVIQPSSVALVPVKHMALVFLVLLAVTTLFAVALSFNVARRIARPITALTGFTQHFMREKTLPPEPTESGGEVGELTHAFVQTVRELEQSRHDLVRASKLAVIGELSAAMAHEVRTPLGILRSSAQMLAREPGLSPEAGELIGFIESETARLNNLVSTLLDSARPRPPSLRPCDMHDLIGHSLGLLASQAEKKGVQLTTRLETSHPIVACDAEQMTQVLLNLVLNAIQILPAGGTVEVACRGDNDAVVIEVSDNGPGIPPAERAQVFDSFFSRREGGLGLGLAIVQQIVLAHGGTISVGESALGGARFAISLPHNTSESK
jgi:two-component system sensor histidine kinase HydH